MFGAEDTGRVGYRLKDMQYLDCESGCDRHGQPAAVITFGHDGEVEQPITLQLRDVQVLAVKLLRTLGRHGNKMAMEAVETYFQRTDVPIIGIKPMPEWEQLRLLKGTEVMLSVDYPGGAVGTAMILAAFRSEVRSVLCLCRDEQQYPPHHFILRFGPDDYGFPGCMPVHAGDEDYIEWFYWPRAVGARHGTKVILNKKWYRKLPLRELRDWASGLE